jgi:sugar lactone lactonase YvrE
MSEIKVIYEGPNIVGECPRWNETDQCLYWTDIYQPAIHRYNPATEKIDIWDMPESVGSFAFREQGGMIAGTRTGFAFIDLDAGSFDRLANPLPNDPEMRMNDGRCDHGGRFWVGSMIESLDQPVGKLFRYDPDGTVTEMVSDLICPNGMAFSSDGKTMYRSDSRQDTIWVSDFDIANGTFSNERIFYENDMLEGRPDGAAVDVDGYYWITYVQGWRVMRIAPDGVVDRVIGLPAQRPTMCCLGGLDMQTLYVTTATYPLPDNLKHKQPLAGALFAIDVGVKGLIEPRFKG